MFGLKLSKKKEAAGAVGSGVMFLHGSDLGWRSRVVDPQDPGAPGERGEPLQRAPQPNEHRIEAVFRQAGEAFGQRERAAIGRVHALTDDPDVHYTDTRGEVFNTASRTATGVLRAYGVQQLNTPKVTFGFADFGRTSAGVREAGVAAFADSSRVGGCLGRLDKLSVRVVSLVPVADVLARRAADLGDAPYGALYVGGYATHVLFADPAHGIVTHRVLRVGTMTLIESMAQGSGVDAEEAARTMRARDILAEVRLVDLSGTDAAVSRSAADRVLGPLLRQYVADIVETLDYFQNQRVSRAPERIELFGDGDRVSGFEAFLVNAMPLDVARSTPIFDLFCRQAGQGSLNLLEQVGQDLQIGQVAYAFRDERLVPAAELAAEAPAARDRRQSAAKAPGRGKAGRGAARPRPGTLADLIARLQGAPTGAAQPDGEGAAKERQYFLLFGLLFGLVLLFAWSKYDGQAAPYGAAARGVTQAVDENSRLHQTLADDRRIGRASTDKVLWTEKFLAIGRNLNNHMWLTDVYLMTERRQLNGAEVLSKKLVLEGAVLPSTDGHIKEIAGFIKRLEEDSGQFMGDFREIKFHGASLDQAESDPIIRFSIDAWYDENKRLQSRAEAKHADGTLGDMQQKVRERNEKLDSMGGSR